MRIERDAVTANSRSGIEGHESEWFGGSCANNFPGVDVQRIAKPGHLVSHTDVDCAESVFKQCCCFSDTRRSYCVNIVNYL